MGSESYREAQRPENGEPARRIGTVPAGIASADSTGGKRVGRDHESSQANQATGKCQCSN
jgi:hypothetical protein